MEILIANESHFKYAEIICDTIAESAKVRGTGIAKGNFAGFCYIEIWGHEKYVANSGLIVHPDYRDRGLAKQIKQRIFELSRKKFPDAKIFGITTGLAVMKINYELGYKPTTFSELTDDPEFWKGCQTCKNFDILTRTERKMCLCTAMLYDSEAKEKSKTNIIVKEKLNTKAFKRLKSIKETLFLKKKEK